ncbi:MAG: hypothetical protein ACRDRL_06280, partial [Sciscionella sp.]
MSDTAAEDISGTDDLELALASSERRVDTALRSTSVLTRELKRAKTAASRGELRELRRSLAAVEGLATQADQMTGVAARSFAFDDSEYLASGAYAKELCRVADERGLAMLEIDDLLLCYPSLVRVLPGDQAVEIDRRRERRLRPSVLVDVLTVAQK